MAGPFLREIMEKETWAAVSELTGSQRNWIWRLNVGAW